ncbi:MAG: hypothetical protein LLG00_12890 [Planctomycetaceae bacterium]|nr:hypothetical protein [Planctomycetaceae bacterium]
MCHVEIRSKVGADGVLTISLPLGLAEANREVRVVVEPSEHLASSSVAEWREFIGSMQGCISDPTFRRPDQGEYESRGEVFP